MHTYTILNRSLLITNIDHMRISVTEPSSMVLRKTKSEIVYFPEICLFQHWLLKATPCVDLLVFEAFTFPFHLSPFSHILLRIYS